jgi:DNA repair photolyase
MSVVRASESLHARITRWLAPLSNLPGGYALDGLETEQGITLTLRSRESVLRVELERADPSRPCFVTTKLFNVYYDSAAGEAVDRAPDVVNAVVAVIRAHESELTIADTAESTRAEVREIEVARGLVREGDHAYYLNPYVGCMLGCQFCYAIHRADLSRALDGRPRAQWGKWVDVKINLPSVVAEEVKRLAPGTVRMSPIITDPYQPLERRYRITRGVLEALPRTFTPVVLTRASLVQQDIPLLASFGRAFLGVSIPTDDDEVRAVFEPATESIASRLETLRVARLAGITTFAIVQPMLPMDAPRLVDQLADLVFAVRIGPLYEKHRALPMFQAVGRTLDEKRTFEELSARFASRGVVVNPSSQEWSFLRG